MNTLFQRWIDNNIWKLDTQDTGVFAYLANCGEINLSFTFHLTSLHKALDILEDYSIYLITPCTVI